MKKTAFERRLYVRPEIKVIEVDDKPMICAVSVRPNPGSGSGHSSWDEKDHEGGTGFIGDESSVAPAKQGGLWNYDDEEDY